MDKLKWFFKVIIFNEKIKLKRDEVCGLFQIILSVALIFIVPAMWE